MHSKRAYVTISKNKNKLSKFRFVFEEPFVPKLYSFEFDYLNRERRNIPCACHRSMDGLSRRFRGTETVVGRVADMGDLSSSNTSDATRAGA
jgi:hypothetical protein